MRWRTVLLATVLAAGGIACAGRETTPTSPGSGGEDGSSQSPTGPTESPRPPQPPNPPTPPPASGSCDHTKAQWTIGQPASDDLLERARLAAGAGSARFLRPNQPVTMEYLGSRLNLCLDGQDVVRSVVCG
jgi:Peptidase inhibitor I78 family